MTVHYIPRARPQLVSFQAPPVANVIDVLEDWRSRAKAGEIQGVAMVADTGPGGMLHAIVGYTHHTLLLGHISRLSYKLNRDCDHFAVPIAPPKDDPA